jgi:hypothetical protein
MRTVSVPRWRAQADIDALVRSFPSERIRVFRPVTASYTRFLQREATEQPVFDGKALFVQAGGDVRRFGLGQVEEENPKILLAGWQDIDQGDMVRHLQLLPGGRGYRPARLYRVRYAPDPWHAWMLVQLEQYQQGT